jgi:hypothetical protein
VFSLFSVHLEEEVVGGEKNLLTLMLQGYLDESPIMKRRVSVPERNVISGRRCFFKIKH